MASTKNGTGAALAACAVLTMLVQGCAQPPQPGERFRSGAALEPTPVREGAHYRQARRIRGDAPITPVSAAIHRTPGFVCLSIAVDAKGQVHDVVVLKATEPIFGVHAAHAVKDWVFEPALRDGKPVASSYRQYFWFNEEASQADRDGCLATARPPARS